MINDHFGEPSVYCGQILQKNPGKVQSPPPFLAMPGVWEHFEPQPGPSLKIAKYNDDFPQFTLSS